MFVLWRMLTLLLALRLLVPSGVCLCHLFDSDPACPADSEEEQQPGHDEHEHAPGCPASQVAGDYLSAESVRLAAPSLCCWTPLLPPLPPVALSPICGGLTALPHLAEQPIYLTVRALLI